MTTYPEIQQYIGPTTPVTGVSGNSIVIDTSINNQIIVISEGSASTSGIRQFDVSSGTQTADAVFATIFTGVSAPAHGTAIALGSPFIKKYDGEFLTTYSFGSPSASAAWARIDQTTFQTIQTYNPDAGPPGFGSWSFPNYPPSPVTMEPASVGIYNYAVCDGYVGSGWLYVLEADADYFQFAGHAVQTAEGNPLSTRTVEGSGVVYSTASFSPSGNSPVIGLYKTAIVSGAEGYALGSWPTQNSNISTTKIGTFAPVDVDATWTYFTNVSQPGYDQSDGNILLFVDSLSGDKGIYLIKVNAATAAVMWAVSVVAHPSPDQYAFGGGNIKGGSYRFVLDAIMYVVDTATGAAVTTHLNGMASELSVYDYYTNSAYCHGSWFNGGAPPTPVTGTTGFDEQWFRIIFGEAPAPPPAGRGKLYMRKVKISRKPHPPVLKSAVGSAHGKGGAAAFAGHSILAVGTAGGTGAASAQAGRTATAVGSAVGAGVTAAIAGGGVTAAGTSAGAGTASAISGGVITAVGTAAGQGAAAGVSSIPGLLTTMTLVNTSGSTQGANFITPIFGMTFKKGDIITGTAPIFSVSGTPQPYSWGLQSYYSDGSLRHASFMFRCSSSITGNGTLTVNINSGGTAPSASSRTLTEVYAQNLQVGGAGVGLFGGLVGTWNGYLRSDANNTEQYVYMDGQAGKAWRIKTHMATSSGGTAHGQLEVYHYVTALQDNSGNLGGFRHIGRITQPYYNNDTPTKALRAFSSVTTKYGGGPTTINLTWPFNTLSMVGTNGVEALTVAAAGTHNFYSGAQPGEGSDHVNGVPCYMSATTDGAFSTTQIYWAYTFGQATNNTQLILSKDNLGLNAGAIASTGGNSTLVPIPLCLQAGSIYTGDTQGRPNFFQGTGSMSADNTVRTQFNQAYLHSTGAIPPWNLSVTGTAFSGTIKDIPAIVTSSSQAYWTGSPTWNPVTCGPFGPAWWGGPGSDPDLGPQSTWTCAHFYNQSAVSDMAIRSMAYFSDSHGSGSMRDVATGNYINVSNSSYTGMPAPSSNQQTGIFVVSNSVGGFTGPSTPPAGNQGCTWGADNNDVSHKPNMAFYGFLIFGEPHFYDLMIEAATGGLLEQYAPFRVPTTPSGYYGITMVYSEQGLRGSAWELRDLMLGAIFAAAISPDGSQLPQYLNDLVTNNINYINAIYNSTYQGSALAAQNRWNRIAQDASFPDFADGGFMASYFECIMAWLAALGNAGALTWTNNYATWVEYVLSTYGGYHLYAEYDGVCVFDGTGDVTGPITNLNQYGIICGGCFSSLSWTTGNPAFTANSPSNGYVVTAGDRIVFGADQGAPASFSVQTPYYVRDVSGNSFNLSASLGGSPITPGSTVGSPLVPGSSPYFLDASSPFMILAAPPTAASGGIPAATRGEDSYTSYRAMAFNWAAAAGASGYSSVLTDAVTRLAAQSPDFTINANWYGQNTL